MATVEVVDVDETMVETVVVVTVEIICVSPLDR